jgi:hypothetical protein
VELPKVLICNERSGMLSEIALQARVVDTLIESYSDATDSYAQGFLSALKLQRKALDELTEMAKPISTARAVAVLGHQLSIWQSDEWNRILRLIDGLCSVELCGDFLADEDGWSPDKDGVLDATLCHAHLIEVLDDERANRYLSLDKEGAA